MPGGFSTIICAMPSEARFASAARGRVAHMAFHIGAEMALLQTGGLPPGGGLMSLDDGSYDNSPGDAGRLADECLSLCRGMGLEGLVCDFEQPPQRTLEAFIAQGAELFSARGMSFYVPEKYASVHGGAKIFISTAITSGSLRSLLAEKAERYGARRLALELEKVCRDITLPAPSGMGAPLAKEKLDEMLKARGGAAFFSAELCARYFTLKDDAGRTHFILFDDASTFRQKVSVALSLGIREGFVLYPDADAAFGN